MERKRQTLNHRQEAFARAIAIEHMPQSRAAIAAGYAVKCAEPTGSRLIRNSKVAARIRELQREMLKRQQMSADEYWAILANAAREPTHVDGDVQANKARIHALDKLHEIYGPPPQTPQAPQVVVDNRSLTVTTDRLREIERILSDGD